MLVLVEMWLSHYVLGLNQSVIVITSGAIVDASSNVTRVAFIIASAAFARGMQK
jgi:hypothetical protein